ncbi:hypothetical protein ACLOJK_013303 [Asimina triloba]
MENDGKSCIFHREKKSSEISFLPSPSGTATAKMGARGGWPQIDMGRETSLRSKAAHFVTDLTTVLLNPISSDEHSPPLGDEIGMNSQEILVEDDSKVTVDGPDTSSFTAFLVSLLSSSEPGEHPSNEFADYHSEIAEMVSESGNRDSSGKRSLISIGKQSLGRAISRAARLGGYRHKSTDKKVDHFTQDGDPKDSKHIGSGLKPVELQETVSYHNLPEMSEPSLLLSENTRKALCMALPALVRERKWVLLYRWVTFRSSAYLEAWHISFNSIQKKCALPWSLSAGIVFSNNPVVGDRKGAVFGGLVENYAGANRYFTLCSTDFLALGGGGHFALYLDGDLLSGSSSFSETFGNSCLAHTEDFDVKEVELWGFVYGSKYDETLALCRTEVPVWVANYLRLGVGWEWQPITVRTA